MTGLFLAVAACLVRRSGETGTIRGTFVFPADFAGFQGHFPGRPVLPGIVQIMAVLCLCGKDEPPRLLQIQNCKFIRAVVPGERVNVFVSMAYPLVRAEMLVGEDTCAVMTLLVE